MLYLNDGVMLCWYILMVLISLRSRNLNKLHSAHQLSELQPQFATRSAWSFFSPFNKYIYRFFFSFPKTAFLFLAFIFLSLVSRRFFPHQRELLTPVDCKTFMIYFLHSEYQKILYLKNTKSVKISGRKHEIIFFIN